MILEYNIAQACPSGLNFDQVIAELQTLFGFVPGLAASGERSNGLHIAGTLTITTPRDMLPDEQLQIDATLLASGPDTGAAADEGKFAVRLAALSRRLKNAELGTFKFVKNSGAGVLVYRAPDGWRRAADDSLLVPIA